MTQVMDAGFRFSMLARSIESQPLVNNNHELLGLIAGCLSEDNWLIERRVGQHKYGQAVFSKPSQGRRLIICRVLVSYNYRLSSKFASCIEQIMKENGCTSYGVVFLFKEDGKNIIKYLRDAPKNRTYKNLGDSLWVTTKTPAMFYKLAGVYGKVIEIMSANT